MEYTYFPVTLAQLGATIRYHDLVEGSFAVENVRIVAKYLNHPALALGYRLEAGAATVVYASGHEPHAPWASTESGAGAGGAPRGERGALRHAEFLAGADLVIHDAQYDLSGVPREDRLGSHAGRVRSGSRLAGRARRLALYHHDPLRDDAGVDDLVASCRRRVAAAGGQLEVFAAAEGQMVELAEGAGVSAPSAGPAVAPSSARAETILVADDDPAIVMLLRASLESDGFRVVTASDGMAALDLARVERPALLLLDWQMPRASGVEVTRALRDDSDPHLRATPGVLITAQSGAENTAAGFAAGVTDYLTKPFRPAHVRALHTPGSYAGTPASPTHERRARTIGHSRKSTFDLHRVEALRSLSRALLRVVLLIGGLALVGWQLDVDALKSVLPGRVAMNPLTALSFLLAAASLWLLEAESAGSHPRMWMSRAAWIGAGSVVAIGVVTILGYTLGENIGPTSWSRARLSNNRIAPNTAVNFILIGGAPTARLGVPVGPCPAQLVALLPTAIA
jgi:CheY-like chemotaxis protein